MHDSLQCISLPLATIRTTIDHSQLLSAAPMPQTTAHFMLKPTPVYLNAAEKEAYGKAWRSAKQQWEVMRSCASANKCRLRAMTLLQPMRRVCSGGRCDLCMLLASFAAADKRCCVC
jgi:hypothetical protein